MCVFVCVASGSLFYYAFDVTIPIGWDLTCDIFLVYFFLSSFNMLSHFDRFPSYTS